MTLVTRVFYTYTCRENDLRIYTEELYVGLTHTVGIRGVVFSSAVVASTSTRLR